MLLFLMQEVENPDICGQSEAWKKTTEHDTRVLLKYDEVGFTQNCKSCFRASYSKSFLPHGFLPERVELGGAGERAKCSRDQPQNSILNCSFTQQKVLVQLRGKSGSITIRN